MQTEAMITTLKTLKLNGMARAIAELAEQSSFKVFSIGCDEIAVYIAQRVGTMMVIGEFTVP